MCVFLSSVCSPVCLCSLPSLSVCISVLLSQRQIELRSAMKLARSAESKAIVGLSVSFIMGRCQRKMQNNVQQPVLFFWSKLGWMVSHERYKISDVQSPECKCEAVFVTTNWSCYQTFMLVVLKGRGISNLNRTTDWENVQHPEWSRDCRGWDEEHAAGSGKK